MKWNTKVIRFFYCDFGFARMQVHCAHNERIFARLFYSIAYNCLQLLTFLGIKYLGFLYF